jgi:tetratricopeptide (TPR) repeat protein
MERALEAYRDVLAANPTSDERVQAHLRTGRVFRSLSQWDGALAESRRAASLAREIGAHDLVAEAINVEIGVHQSRGDFDAAEVLAEQALTHARSHRVRGITLQNRGAIATHRGEQTRADEFFTESIEEFRLAGYNLGLAIALTNASEVARQANDAGRALDLANQAAALCRRYNYLDILLAATENQAAALVMLGQLDDAERLLTEALGHFTSAKHLGRQAECLELMGEVSERRLDQETALRCYKRAMELATAASDRALATRLTDRMNALRQ